eukprot:2285837-Rhodomonas_salina.1
MAPVPVARYPRAARATVPGNLSTVAAQYWEGDSSTEGGEGEGRPDGAGASRSTSSRRLSTPGTTALSSLSTHLSRHAAAQSAISAPNHASQTAFGTETRAEAGGGRREEPCGGT